MRSCIMRIGGGMKAKTNIDQKGVSSILDFSGQYFHQFDLSKLSRSNRHNCLGDYMIHHDQELSEYGKPFAKAFAASSHSKPDEEYIALVFKRGMPVRLNEMLLLNNYKIPNLQTPVEIGVCSIDAPKKYYLAAILPRPEGMRLYEITNSNCRLDEITILQTILPSLINSLNILHQRNIVHSHINPHNIFFDGENVTIGECISEISGASQPAFYETIERGQAHPYGKGNGENAIDYYALGMTLYFLITGEDYRSLDLSSLIREKIYENTFNFINKSGAMSTVIADIICGLVVDDPTKRYSFHEVDNILKNRKYTLLNPNDRSSHLKIINFNEKEHVSKASLVHELACNWEDGKEFIAGEAIIKWLELNYNQQDVVEALANMNFTIQKRDSTFSTFSKNDEKLMRTIMILDPNGPIRIKDLAFRKEGIGTLLSFAIAANHAAISQTLADFLFSNFFQYYTNANYRNKNIDIIQQTNLLSECSINIARRGVGFGLERCLYDLNPSLTCNSSTLEEDWYMELAHILQTLEANKSYVENITTNRHLLCFIASRVNLLENVKSSHLSYMNNLEKTVIFQTMALLAIAQNNSNTRKLPALCKALTAQLEPLISEIMHNEKLKSELIGKLYEVAAIGNLLGVLRTLMSPAYLPKDAYGFAMAQKRAQQIGKEMELRQDEERMERRVIVKALQFSTIFTYIVCGCIFVYLILNNF